MRHAFVILFVLHLCEGVLAPRSAAAQDGKPPSAYTGRWEGSAAQINPTAKWPLAITLTGGPVGAVVGTIEYPSLACGGELTLSRISGADNSVELAENLTHGDGVCADNGVVSLVANSEDSLAYRWAHPTVNSPATGVLTRAPSTSAVAFPTVASTATATRALVEHAEVTFTLEDAVSPEDEASIREAIRLAQDGLTELFGADVREPVSVAVEYDPEGGQFSNRADAHQIFINTWNFRGYPPSVRVMFTVHEYVHVWQMELAERDFSPGLSGPTWLIEGSAEFVAWRIVAGKGIVTAEDADAFIVAMANGIHASGPVAPPPLSELTTVQDMFAEDAACCSYALGAIAVGMLTDEAGISSLQTYFENLGSGWESAFETAFGTTADDFYAAFETQRPARLTPSGRDVNAIARTPPFNDVPADAAIAFATTQVERGEQGLLTGWTASGAHCMLTLSASDSSLLLNQPTYADAYGGVFWLWHVASDAPTGTATADVNCGGAPATVVVEIT